MLRVCTILFISLLIAAHSFGQRKAPRALIKKGERLIDEYRSDEIYKLGKYFVQRYKGDPQTQVVVCEAADVAIDKNDYDWAEKAYLLVLETDDPTIEEGTIFPKGYSFYKSHACSRLVKFYMDKRDYTKALQYLELSETTYPEFRLCGNDASAYGAFEALDYAICYEGLGKNDSAINRLWPFIFDYHLKGSDPFVAEKLMELLKKRYTNEQVAAGLIRAEHTITVNLDSNWHNPTIVIFGNKVEMPEIDPRQMKKQGVDDEQNAVQLTRAYKELYRSIGFYQTFVH